MLNLFDCFDYSKPLSLYIHIPFCIKKCSYCAFYSTDKANSQIKDLYTEKIVSEIIKLNSLMHNKPFYTAFIGGGNPGCLGSKNLSLIAQAVCENGRPLEFTTEMNPESLTKDMTVLFRTYFNRLSMGVQSLNPQALSFLGRNADLEKTVKGLELSQSISQMTGCELSYDLITCLGDFHDALNDVRQISKNFPSNHLSVYALTLEEGTPLYHLNPKLPDDDQQADILESVWNYLKDIGFEHYEVSNFAKNGKRSIHNCVYWDYKPYIGLGCGASSTGFKDNKGYRISIKKNIDEYLKYGSEKLSQTEELSLREMKEEFLFMGLRHRDGLDLIRLKNQFNTDSGPIPEGFYVLNNHLVPDDFGLLTADAAALYIDSRW